MRTNLKALLVAGLFAGLIATPSATAATYSMPLGGAATGAPCFGTSQTEWEKVGVNAYGVVLQAERVRPHAVCHPGHDQRQRRTYRRAQQPNRLRFVPRRFAMHLELLHPERVRRVLARAPTMGVHNAPPWRRRLGTQHVILHRWRDTRGVMQREPLRSRARNCHDDLRLRTIEAVDRRRACDRSRIG